MTEKPLVSVSVVVPVYNGGRKFIRCLDALEHCDPRPCEILIVADGRSDECWTVALQRGYKIILLEKQCGPAKARNVGAAQANGDVLLFIDADVEVRRDIIYRIQMLFEKHTYLSAIIGSYDDSPFEQNLLSQYRNLLHHYIHQTAQENASTFWGACGAIRKSVFTAAGGFAPRYGSPSIEDIEFGYRLKQLGLTILLHKDLQVKHLKKWTFLLMLKTDIFNRAIPWTELLLKQERISRDLNLSLVARLSTFLVFLLISSSLVSMLFAKMFPAAILCCALLLTINRKFYSFLARKRGMFFLLQSLPLHWLYYFYSGVSFAFVYLRDNFWRRFVRFSGWAKLFSS